MPTFLTPAAVAERWDCSEEHVCRLARSRQLRGIRLVRAILGTIAVIVAAGFMVGRSLEGP